MEMRAREDIKLGQDITPPLSPIAFSLHDPFLPSHCSSCFSPLPTPPFLPATAAVFYCSSLCSAADSSLHFSSAEHHLLIRSRSAASTLSDSADLRLALRLLHSLNLNSASRQNRCRINGLLTNYDEFVSRDDGNDEIVRRVRDGAEAMEAARRMRDDDGGMEGFDRNGEDLAAAALCLVLTNAVEVQCDGGGALGIALYDTQFSWINHSCSPNACYRFLRSTVPVTDACSDQFSLRIAPVVGSGCSEIENEDVICRRIGLREGGAGYGPRIVVKSIKAIKKGEEVSIAYTDLLQPKEIRQSELWLKYCFICCCSRCSTLPSTYVDQALQEIVAVDPNCKSLSAEQISNGDEYITQMTNYVEDAIYEYLSTGNPKPCCEKLENMLTRGLPVEHIHNKSIRLHPLHHLSLNAYTTLSSAYKILENYQTAAAYALVLAGATHHLFLYEPSLIASLANFWTNAGESLLCVARNLDPLPNIPSKKCSKCSLKIRFEDYFLNGQLINADLEEVSSEFLDCVTDLVPKVWSFLSRGCSYLASFEDPVYFSWLRNDEVTGECNLRRVSKCEMHIIDERVHLFQLSFHMLLFGRILSSICYGEDSYLTSQVRDLLCDES